MRLLLVGCGSFAALAAALLSWPYQSEVVSGTVLANPTGCHIDVQNFSGWTRVKLAPGLRTERVKDPLDAYAFVSGCPGSADGRPAALAVEIGRQRVAAEDCGVNLKIDAVCRAPIRQAPHRYRLWVRIQPTASPQPMDIDVRRIRSWRSVVIDRWMSV